MKEHKEFFWHDKPEIGAYNFCYGGIFDCDFYIEEVAVKYTYGWTEEQRQREFKGAKFVWGGCSNGVGYSNHPLKADNIDDAKKEFEAWYARYLADRIEGLKKALDASQEEYNDFLRYQKED